MKVNFIIVSLALLFNKTIVCSQTSDAVQVFSKNKVSFVTIFDKANETKDGYYVNGYVVNISHERGQELHLKKIKITGKITIVKGLKHDKPEEPIRQGRYEDTKHILKPVIEIIE